MPSDNYFSQISDPHSVITAIDSAVRFPEILDLLRAKYESHIQTWLRLIDECDSSEALLHRIRSKEFDKDERMSLLKMFRRCVSPVLDTETTKKIQKVRTSDLVTNYGHTFKSITTLKRQFKSMSQDSLSALAALVGEYDTRGQLGYQLTNDFFNWFEDTFNGVLTIEGPRGAGRDIELSSLFPEYQGSFPADFAIKDAKSGDVLAVGFARYDSTRGGAQSDDRTGGNANKVTKLEEFCRQYNKNLRLLFVSDGPGLSHKDTWAETCELDDAWGGNVRVTTLKTAHERVTLDWLKGIR